MKEKQTGKIDSFTNWRINIRESLPNNLKIRSFVWIQVNYSIDCNANKCNIHSVIFEEKAESNINTSRKLIEQIQYKLNLVNIPSYCLNLTTIPSYQIAEILNLKLLYNPKYINYDSYWNYRLDTKPQNCLTCDIDSFEIGKEFFILIEAAQLFNTNKNTQLEDVVRHIFRTFARRKNKVNPFQYIAQNAVAQRLNSKSFIMFHKINNNIFDKESPALLLNNNNFFHQILFDIACNYNTDSSDENKFIEKYKLFFKENLIQYNNAYELYLSLGIIY